MTYSPEFIDLVNIANKQSEAFYKGIETVIGRYKTTESYSPTLAANPYYVGFGNPNANILFIGKEKGFETSNESQLKAESIDNVNQWKFLIEKNVFNCNYLFENEFLYQNYSQFKNPIIPYCQIKKGGHTWSKYNKLVKEIFKRNPFKDGGLFIENHSELNGIKCELFNTSFLLNAFITELNYEPSKISKGEKNIQGEINTRISFLRESAFYQNFEIIILAVGPYIGELKIKEIFGATLVQIQIPDELKGGQKLVVYKNDNKIIVHTRQLSFDIKDSYLENIAKIIHDERSK